MRHFSLLALPVWQRNRDVFLALSRSEVPGIIAEPLFVLLSMGLGLGAYIGLIDGQEYVVFIAPGIMAGYGMFSSTFECTYGSFVRMDYQKTWDAIMATPVSVGDIVAGEIFWGATRGLITSAGVLVIAAAFGLIDNVSAILILPLSLLSGLMFSSIALSFTAIAPAISSFSYFFTLVITPMFFFGGVFFPLNAFPEVIQKLGWIVPLKPVAELYRSLVMGQFSYSMIWQLLIVVAVTLVFFELAQRLMHRRLLK